MKLALRLARWAIGVLNAGFVALAAAELGGAVLSAATRVLQAWAWAHIRTLINPPQAQIAAQESQS